MTEDEPSVWVFNGESNHFPSAVFTAKKRAEAWIAEHRLTGVLTRYPLDEPVYDWVIRRGLWSPKRDSQQTPEFIANFSSAYTGHDHYTDGEA